MEVLVDDSLRASVMQSARGKDFGQIDRCIQSWLQCRFLHDDNKWKNLFKLLSY